MSHPQRGKNYERVPKRALRFKDRQNGVSLDILVTGLFPGNGEPGPIAYPDPITVNQSIDKISVVKLDTLIELKLAARRYRDFGDVVELIRCNDVENDGRLTPAPPLAPRKACNSAWNRCPLTGNCLVAY